MNRALQFSDGSICYVGATDPVGGSDTRTVCRIAVRGRRNSQAQQFAEQLAGWVDRMAATTLVVPAPVSVRRE